MASKKRSVSKKTSPSPKAPKKAAPAPATVGEMPSNVTLKSADDVQLGPARGRTSVIEPVVEALLKDLSKIAVYDVPEGRKARQIRSMLYPRISAILARRAPDRQFTTSIRQTKDGNLAIQITEA